MSHNRTTLVIETFAFSAFLKSYDEMSAYCFLTQSTINDPWSLADIDETKFAEGLNIIEAKFHQIISILKTARSIAKKLTVVYLAAIVEAYVKDALILKVARNSSD